MDKVMKWGILSTANIAQQSIIPAIQHSKNSEVYGIASESGKATEVANSFQIQKAYDSYYALLEDPEIEAVYIPLPNALHKKWVIESAKKGKHVLCEKPAALNLSDLEEMVQTCAENDVFFMEGFMYQFHPQHQRVKEILSSGEIGEIRHINSVFTFQLDLSSNDIRLNRDLGGGCVFDVGCYCIHSSLLLLNQDPKQVYVSSNLSSSKTDVETTASGLLTFDKGVTMTFHCSFEEPMTHQYEIFGTKGSIRIPFAFRPDLREGEGVITVTDNNGTIREEQVYGDQYLLQIEHFVQSIQEKKADQTTNLSLRNLKLIEACRLDMG